MWKTGKVISRKSVGKKSRAFNCWISRYLGSFSRLSLHVFIGAKKTWRKIVEIPLKSCSVREFNWWLLLSAIWRNYRPFPSFWRNFTSPIALQQPHQLQIAEMYSRSGKNWGIDNINIFYGQRFWRWSFRGVHKFLYRLYSTIAFLKVGNKSDFFELHGILVLTFSKLFV